MKVAIHQPEYWPIPRLLAKWAAADMLVILDIAQFDRSSLQHRARLKSQFDGTYRWLTIPFVHAGPQQIRVLEPAERTWSLKHWYRLREWYRSADEARMGLVGTWFNDRERGQAISTYSLESMEFLAKLLKIETPIILASAMMPPEGGWGGKSDLVLNLCRAAKCSVYLSGVRGATYLDWNAFERVGISIEVQAYKHTSSEPELSALHTFLESGPEALAELVKRTQPDA